MARDPLPGADQAVLKPSKACPRALLQAYVSPVAAYVGGNNDFDSPVHTPAWDVDHPASVPALSRCDTFQICTPCVPE